MTLVSVLNLQVRSHAWHITSSKALLDAGMHSLPEEVYEDWEEDPDGNFFTCLPESFRPVLRMPCAHQLSVSFPLCVSPAVDPSLQPLLSYHQAQMCVDLCHSYYSWEGASLRDSEKPSALKF
jgi:hypothetical protein